MFKKEDIKNNALDLATNAMVEGLDIASNNTNNLSNYKENIQNMKENNENTIMKDLKDNINKSYEDSLLEDNMDNSPYSKAYRGNLYNNTKSKKDNTNAW